MREHGNGMYRTDVYFLAKTMAEFPLYILFPAVFVAICYFMIGLNSDVTCFFICVGIVILVANCAASFGKLRHSIFFLLSSRVYVCVCAVWGVCGCYLECVF